MINFDYPKDIYIRVDGGDIHSVAMGHIYRCLKIAELLIKDWELDITFISKNNLKGIKKIEDHGFAIIKLEPDITVEEEIDAIFEHAENKLLITDVRHYSKISIETIRNKMRCLVMFDDLGNQDITPDILINPSVLPAHRKYDFNPRTQYLIGPEFFVLGNAPIVRKQIGRDVKTILISLGGADPAFFTEELINKISAIASSFNYIFVLGPAYENCDKFIEIKNKLGFTGKVMCDVDNLPTLMLKADLAIVAGGDTALELAYMGVPGLIAPTIDYEGEIAKYLMEKGIFISLGDIKTRAAEAVVSQILAVSNDYEKRLSLSNRGRELIDGMGANRISAAIGKKFQWQ